MTKKDKDPFYSKENMARLKESMEQIEKDGGKEHNLDRFSDTTEAAMEEARKIMRGEITAKSYNSLTEALEELED